MRAIALTALLLLTACTTTRLDEAQFFHPGPATNLDDLKKWPHPARHVFLTAADGTKLHGVRVTRRDAVAEVLYFGGDAFRVDEYGAYVATALTNANVNMLIMDHRGYGRSEGTPSIAALRRDALTVFDSLRNETKLPIVVHGASLGSFIAAHVAASRQPEGLILEGAATTAREWVQARTPFYARVRLSSMLAAQDNVARLRTYRNPLLILTGELDEVTPPAMARRLLEEAASPQKELVLVKEGRHGNSLGKPDAIEAYRRLIDRVATRS